MRTVRVRVVGWQATLHQILMGFPSQQINLLCMADMSLIAILTSDKVSPILLYLGRKEKTYTSSVMKSTGIIEANTSSGVGDACLALIDHRTHQISVCT